jgi:predicted porin
MKKHLIAAAVAAAVAAPVMAQNVSIGGYIEQGFTNSRTDGSATTNKIVAGPNGSSRLAITGSEDLGSGLKAGFRLEMSLNTTTGQGGSTDMANATTGSGLFNRGADFNLSGAFGTVKIGKMDHPGLEGNELSTVGNLGLFDTDVESYNSNANTSDVNNTIIYTTPVISGATLTVGYTGKNDGANANGSGWTHEGITSAQIAGSINGVSYKLGTGTYKEASGGLKHKAIGGGVSYNFGIANVGVYHQKMDVNNSTNDKAETIVTAAIPVGAGLTVLFANNNYDLSNSSTSDINKTSIGLKKELSKRTSVYAIYKSTDNGGTTADVRDLGFYVGHSF